MQATAASRLGVISFLGFSTEIFSFLSYAYKNLAINFERTVRYGKLAIF